MNINEIKDIIKNLKINGNVRKNAEAYKNLYVLAKEIETKMSSIKPKLIESKVFEIFEDDDLKVIFEDGKVKSYLDTKRVYKEVKNLDSFLEVATVSEKSLKDNFQDADEIIAKSKIILEEKTNPAISVRKLTKEDKLPCGIL